MSNAIYEHIKKYPDFYIDKKPVIVKELYDERKIFLSDIERDGCKWFLLQNKFDYFVDKYGRILKAKLSEEDYKKNIRRYEYGS